MVERPQMPDKPAAVAPICSICNLIATRILAHAAQNLGNGSTGSRSRWGGVLQSPSYPTNYLQQ